MGGETLAWKADRSLAACILGRVESRSHPKFLPRLALKCIWIRILTYQFPFPGLMIPEDFSWLGCGEEFVFIYSRALRIIPEIISLLESMGIALCWASCCGEQSADTLQVSWGGGNSSDPHVPPEHGLFQLCLAMSLSLQKHYSSFEAFRNSAAHCRILLMWFLLVFFANESQLQVTRSVWGI